MVVPVRPTISVSGIGLTTADLASSAYAEPLLLDSLSGTVAAAYSLRKLRAGYSGSAIRVRRSSDNTEQDIGFSGENLDTASLLTFAGAGSAFVTALYGQAASEGDPVQATTTNQLRIVNAGSLDVDENGKPWIVNVSSDYLRFAATGSAWVAQPNGIWWLGKPVGDGVFLDAATTGAGLRQYLRIAGGAFVAFAGSEQSSGYSPTLSARNLFGAIFNGASGTLRVNGVQRGGSLNMGAGGLDGLTIMANALPSSFASNNATLQEIVVLSSPSAGDITTLEANVDTYWAVP